MASSERLFRRIVDDQESGFWLTLLRCLLSVCSLIYGIIVRFWLLSYRSGLIKSSSLPGKVVSVGNITVGGTGKTPLVAFLAQLWQSKGVQVVVLSRGYRREGKGTVVVSDGRKILSNPREAGDEPYLLAESLSGVPVLVGKDRVNAGRLAVQMFSPEILLLDDGLQYLRLRRDLDIVAIDASNPFANGHLLPRGILREPLGSLRRARIFWLTRVDQARDLENLKQKLNTINPAARIMECIHRPCFLRRVPDGHQLKLEEISARRVFAFSAIGNHRYFEESLAELGAQVVGTMRFRDHHRYSIKDLERIARLSRNSNAQVVVTTSKDTVNLPQEAIFVAPMWSLAIEIQVVKGLEHLSNLCPELG